ncbi:MAG: peptidylprolyl isomerase [Armatimonadetes bacterium]|nr:peptidylprolyl isomerase [Armatimonadota bacterium]
MSLTKMRDRFGHTLKIGLWLIAGLFVISCFMGYGSSVYNKAANPEETTVAKVNGKEIPREAFDRVYQHYTEASYRPVSDMQATFMKAQVLDQLVEQMVRLQAAREERIRPSREDLKQAKEREIQNALQQVRQSLEQGKPLSQADFEKQVKVRYGKTLPVLTEDIRSSISDEGLRDQVMMEKLDEKIKAQVPRPTEADLKEKYTEVRARHILIDTKSRSEEQAKKRADEVLAKVKAGGDFARLAKDYSDDPGSKVKGGDLGYFRKGMMVPEFEKTAFAQSPGQISDLVKSSFGYHIIKTEDKRVQFPKDFEKNKQKELDALYKENQDKALAGYYKALKERSKVEVMDPELQGARAMQQAMEASMKGDKTTASAREAEALAAFNKALEKFGDTASVYCAIAAIYQQKKDNKQAIAMLNKALQSTDSADIHMALASLYEQAKQKDQAVKHYKMASDAAYDDFMTHIQLQAAFEKLGQKDLAAKEQAWMKKYQAEMMARQQASAPQTATVGGPGKKGAAQKKAAPASKPEAKPAAPASAAKPEPAPAEKPEPAAAGTPAPAKPAPTATTGGGE